MAEDKSTKKPDVKITDLPDKKTNAEAAKVKGGMMPKGGGTHITYTGEEIDTQTGA